METKYIVSLDLLQALLLLLTCFIGSIMLYGKHFLILFHIGWHIWLFSRLLLFCHILDRSYITELYGNLIVLEDVATEFEIQGLELDYTIVAWDADFRMTDDGWTYNSFKGSKWQNVNSEERRLYLKNTYRVLLTRARQGMIIFVPQGSDTDATRPREFYDGTYHYLKGLGITIF